MNKKLIPAVLVSAALLSSCKNSPFPKITEIDEFEVVQVVGLDLDPRSRREVEVTFVSQDTAGSNGKEGSGSKLVSMQSSVAPTVFEAERNIKAHSDKVAFFGYVDYFLIGEEAARDDISKYFDFLVRDHETRLSPKIYIVRNTTAKDLLFSTSSSDNLASDTLKNAKHDRDLLSSTQETSILDISEMLDNQDVGAVIPAIKSRSLTNEQTTGEMPSKDITVCGYVILRDYQLAGYYEGGSARGYNFITNNVSSFAMSVLDSTGTMVGIEVIGAKNKVEARFEGDKPVEVTFKTVVTANIQEQQSRINIFSKESIEKLEEKVSNHVKHDMEQTVAISKKVGVDCLKLGERLRMRYPVKWDKMKDEWRTTFPEVKIIVDVETRIARTYDVREPAGYRKG